MRARLASIKPRVPLVSASHGGKPGHYLDGLVIKKDIKNIGSGPAIDVLAKLEHGRLKFASVTGLTTPGVGEQHAVSLVVSELSTDLGASRELTPEAVAAYGLPRSRSRHWRQHSPFRQLPARSNTSEPSSACVEVVRLEAQRVMNVPEPTQGGEQGL